VIVIDEYLAIRSLAGVLPTDLPDDQPAITTSAHWRILQRIHAPGVGQLSQALGALSLPGRQTLRKPSPAVLQVLDPRPLLDPAAQIAAAYGNTGWLVSETIAAGLAYGGRQLWFGNPRNVGRRMREIADELGVAIHVVA